MMMISEIIKKSLILGVGHYAKKDFHNYSTCQGGFVFSVTVFLVPSIMLILAVSDMLKIPVCGFEVCIWAFALWRGKREKLL